MLVVTFATVLVYFAFQNVKASAVPGAACERGNLSAEGNRSCGAPEPYVIYGHGKAIYRMDLDGGNQRRLVVGVGNSILLDFHYVKKTIYWADRKTGVIYQAAIDGSQRQKVYSTEKDISGLAVDWVHNSLIWTSGKKGTIKSFDSNGKNQRTLLRRLSHPSSIAVAPNDRFMFWMSDGITPSIQRSDLAGKMASTVLKVPDSLVTLSVDQADKRLFWIQFSPGGESAIGSCDYNGNVVNVFAQPLQSQSVGMSVFLENVYYTDVTSRNIRLVNKYSGGETKNVRQKRMAHPPMEVKVVHPFNQPFEDSKPFVPACDAHTGECVNVCSSPSEQGVCQCTDGFALSKHGNYCEDINECGLWDHGCSLGCENIPGSYFCTCPKGYALLPDRKTCQETLPCPATMTKCDHGCLSTNEGIICQCSEGSILQADRQSCTGCSSSDRGGCTQLCSPLTPGRWECHCLPGYKLDQDGKRCKATGSPPYLLFANMVDIRHINVDGSDDHSVLEEPRGALTALDYDPVQNKMYFASTALKQIERADLDGGTREVVLNAGLDTPESLAVDWVNRKLYWTDRGFSVIERSTLDGFDKVSIVSSGIQKPMGIAVHPLAKKLFWTDTGTRPVVESASLEGSDRAVIASTDLVFPSGLSIDFTEDHLYWCDSGRAVLEMASMDGSNRRTLNANEVGQPFDLVVFEDRLWITDWERQLLLSVDKWTGLDPQQLHGNVIQPASIVVVHPLAKPEADVCLFQNGGCAQVCESRLGLAHCSCNSHLTQSADGKGCLPATETDIEDVKSAAPMPLKNQTLNDESRPRPVPEESRSRPVPEESRPRPVPKENKKLPVPEESRPRPVPKENKKLPVPDKSRPHPVPDKITPRPLPDENSPRLVPDENTLYPVPDEITPRPVPDENTPHPVPDKNTPRSVPDENTPRPEPDENRPPPLPEVFNGEKAEDHMTEGTEKMVSDQDGCFYLHCDVNAQCILDGASPACHCLHGFTGDGQLCLDIDECKLGTHHCDERADCINTMGAFQCTCQAGYFGNGHTCQELATTSTWVTTSRPWDTTSQRVKSRESCPSSHDTYCLYEGVCFYLPEMATYACNCISGYMGERCQYSDLEWWDLQQAKQQKRRHAVIAVCMVVLVCLLSIAACITYNYGSRRLFQQHPSVEDMSETSSSDATTSVTTVPNTPRLYVVLEHGADVKNIHVIGCPRRQMYPSCSSETGESFLSEEAGPLPRLSRGYECSSGLATMDTNQMGATHLKNIDNLILLDDPQP